jgi:hypothetical protein
VQFEWSADQAGMAGFNGQVFVHMSTDKPPYTPRLMKDLGTCASPSHSPPVLSHQDRPPAVSE